MEISIELASVKIIDNRTLSYYIGARRLCPTIYIDRYYSNRSRNIESNSVELDSIDTRLDQLQYFDIFI